MNYEYLLWSLVRASIRSALFLWFIWPLTDGSRSLPKIALSALLALIADGVRILPFLTGGGLVVAFTRQIILIMVTYIAALSLLKTQKLFAFYVSAVFTFSCAIWKNLITPYMFASLPIPASFIASELSFTQPVRTGLETLAYFLTLFFIRKAFFNTDRSRVMQPTQVFLVLSPAFSNWIIMVVLYTSFFYEGFLFDYEYGHTLKLAFFMLAASTLAIIVIAEWSFHMNEKELQLQQSQQMLSDAYNRMESQRLADENLRHLQHDMKNHLMTLHALEANSHDAKAYIDKLVGQIQHNVDFVKTGNATLDVVLMQKEQACREKGIELNCFVDFRHGDFLSPMEVCTLFANCLDNAIEAVSSLNKDNRHITLSCTTANGCILAKFSNPSATGPVYQSGKIQSTKDEPEKHGHGLSSVEKIATSHDGALQIKYENGMFQTMWMIPQPANF